jgi:hypothetical protein
MRASTDLGPTPLLLTCGTEQVILEHLPYAMTAAHLLVEAGDWRLWNLRVIPTAGDPRLAAQRPSQKLGRAGSSSSTSYGNARALAASTPSCDTVIAHLRAAYESRRP